MILSHMAGPHALPVACMSSAHLTRLVVRADSDITYVIKPAWASYLAFIDEAQADGAFQEEWGLSECQGARGPADARQWQCRRTRGSAAAK